jgi:hypothetical protein
VVGAVGEARAADGRHVGRGAVDKPELAAVEPARPEERADRLLPAHVGAVGGLELLPPRQEQQGARHVGERVVLGDAEHKRAQRRRRRGRGVLDAEPGGRVNAEGKRGVGRAQRNEGIGGAVERLVRQKLGHHD